MQFVDVGLEFGEAMLPVEYPARLKLPPQVRVEIDAAKAQGGEGPHQMLSPLDAGVPIGHGVEKQIQEGRRRVREPDGSNHFAEWVLPAGLKRGGPLPGAQRKIEPSKVIRADRLFQASQLWHASTL